MKIFQKTIQKKLKFSGIGLHTGVLVTVNLLPADINNGIIFYRKDLEKSRPIIANWSNIKVANLCSMICNNDKQTVSTIEHLMFAFYVLGITNIIVELNGPEIPILDGSSILFIQELLKVGIEEQKQEVLYLKIKKIIKINDKNKFIEYYPTNNSALEIDYTIDYNDQFIKKQRKIIKNVHRNYKEIYNARTFCHQEDLEKIFAMGLAKGGSLDNAIVISGKKILNQDGLRYKDEFVRHKILDCYGDIYLAGFFLNGKIICNQGGHELNYRLLEKIFSNKKNFMISKTNFVS